MKRFYIMIFSVFISFDLSAGVVLTEMTEDGEQTTIFQDETMVSLENGQPTMIVKLKENSCTMLNHHGKKYMQMDCKKLFKMMNDITAGFRNMANNMAPQDMPPGAPKLPPLELEKTGSGKFQGYDIDKYNIKAGPHVAMEYWISPKLLTIIAKEFDYKKFEAMTPDAGPMPQSADPFGMAKAQIEEKEKSLEDKGFIIKKVNYIENGPDAPITKTTNVKIKSVDVNSYMPKGYKKVNKFQDMM